MKKQLSFLFLFLALGFLSKAQSGCPTCPSHSLFSQLPTTTETGAFSDYNTCYTSYDDFNGVSQPIGTIVFWGYEIQTSNGPGCTPGTPFTFEIIFYENSSGDFGPRVATFHSVSATKESCGPSSVHQNAPLYRYTATLPSTVNLSNGWISIRAEESSGGCYFAWATSPTGTPYMWQYCGHSHDDYELNLAFCLNPASTPPPSVPVSGWAVGFLVLLISAILVRRAIM